MNARNGLATLGAMGIGGWLALRAYRSLNAYDFRCKNVVITGGTRGLGLVLARQLAQEGACLALCARNEEEVEQARLQLSRQDTAVFAQTCDLREADEAERFIRGAQRQLGSVDVLINNAGIIEVGPEATMTRGDFENSLDTNFWAAFNTIQAVLPAMRERRTGRIVNIASIGGKVSVPHLLPYSVSKFALVGYSEGLRAELASDGIVVTTVCPGLMRTGSQRNAQFKGRHREEYTWFALGASLPGLSMGAERAARQILDAVRHGDAEIIVGLPARLAVLLQGLMPGMVADVSGLVNRLLPAPGGIGTDSALGSESESSLAPSWLTAAGEEAARRNNEYLAREVLPAPGF